MPCPISERPISERVLIRRRMKGWSQTELASRAGVSLATISRIEAGNRNPSYKILGNIVGGFDQTLWGFFRCTSGTTPLGEVLEMIEAQGHTRFS